MNETELLKVLDGLVKRHEQDTEEMRDLLWRKHQSFKMECYYWTLKIQAELDRMAYQMENDQKTPPSGGEN